MEADRLPRGTGSSILKRCPGKAERQHTRPDMQHSLQPQRTQRERLLGGNNRKKEGEEGIKTQELQIRTRVKRESVYKHMCTPSAYTKILNSLPPTTRCQIVCASLSYLCKALKPCRSTRDEPSQTEATVLVVLSSQTPQPSRTT